MTLKFHPAADVFPLMAGAEFDAFVADIKAKGLKHRIEVYESMVLDGRNRYRALQAAGMLNESEVEIVLAGKCPPGGRRGMGLDQFRWLATDDFGEDGDPRSYVISANIHRRHLTAEQKRDLIAKLIAAAPEKSDREIGKTVKADHKTVGAVRKAKESTGEISPVEKRVGRDGKARKQPVKKAKPKPALEITTPPHVTSYDSPLSAAWARASREHKVRLFKDNWDEVEDVRAEATARS